ncbi:MAG TPA: hypothetical protein VI790_01200 [Candidatus Nanoarchaeia archaeon]|nr:hypothetical protein [Candidatus Nanoarchaeia archaeon]
MILLISTCADKLSEAEFVKPIKELTNGVVKHYSILTSDDLLSASHVIICGTALKDFDYLTGDWTWIKSFTKPLLGICAGYQVILKDFGFTGSAMIGVKKIDSKTDLLSTSSAYFVNSLQCTNKTNFNVLAICDGIPCLLKKGNTIACLFHPEVLNTELIKRFLLL